MTLDPDRVWILRGHAFATIQTRGTSSPESDEFQAWLYLYEQEGENASNFRYEGVFKNDITFAQDTVEGIYGSIPGLLVVDWPNTAQGILSDYEDIRLPDGRKAYFRR